MKLLLTLFLFPASVCGLFWNTWPWCCGWGGGYGGGYGYPAYSAPAAYPAYSPPVVSGGSLPAGSQVIFYEKPIVVSNVDSTQLTPISLPDPPPGYRRTIYQTNYRNYPVGRPTHIAHPIESDPVNGYEPAYSAWNEQPIQAVFKNGESRISSDRPSATAASDTQQQQQQQVPENPPENPPEGPMEKKTAESPTDEEIDEFLKATKEMDKMQKKTHVSESSSETATVSSPFDEIKERKEESEKEIPPKVLENFSKEFEGVRHTGKVAAVSGGVSEGTVDDARIATDAPVTDVGSRLVKKEPFLRTGGKSQKFYIHDRH